MSALWGGLQIASPDNGRLFLIAAFAFALLATLWARYDAKSRSLALLPVLQMLYFFAWPVGAVLYLVYRSGSRGLLTACIHGIGMMLLMALTFYATLYGLHFAGLLDSQFYTAE